MKGKIHYKTTSFFVKVADRTHLMKKVAKYNACQGKFYVTIFTLVLTWYRPVTHKELTKINTCRTQRWAWAEPTPKWQLTAGGRCAPLICAGLLDSDKKYKSIRVEVWATYCPRKQGYCVYIVISRCALGWSCDNNHGQWWESNAVYLGSTAGASKPSPMSSTSCATNFYLRLKMWYSLNVWNCGRFETRRKAFFSYAWFNSCRNFQYKNKALNAFMSLFSLNYFLAWLRFCSKMLVNIPDSFRSDSTKY